MPDPRFTDLRRYLQDYLGLTQTNTERINWLSAQDLPAAYQAQLAALADARLGEVVAAVIPDDLWAKGSQPSESHAERQLILMKQSYFAAPGEADEIAWFLHELAHCQEFLVAGSAAKYQQKMETVAFADLPAWHPYPNNLVEQTAFTKQFQYLKQQGKDREAVLALLAKYYQAAELPFFHRLLDSVYA